MLTSELSRAFVPPNDLDADDSSYVDDYSYDQGKKTRNKRGKEFSGGKAIRARRNPFLGGPLKEIPKVNKVFDDDDQEEVIIKRKHYPFGDAIRRNVLDKSAREGDKRAQGKGRGISKVQESGGVIEPALVVVAASDTSSVIVPVPPPVPAPSSVIVPGQPPVPAPSSVIVPVQPPVPDTSSVIVPVKPHVPATPSVIVPGQPPVPATPSVIVPVKTPVPASSSVIVQVQSPVPQPPIKDQRSVGDKDRRLADLSNSRDKKLLKKVFSGWRESKSEQMPFIDPGAGSNIISGNVPSDGGSNDLVEEEAKIEAGPRGAERIPEGQSIQNKGALGDRDGRPVATRMSNMKWLFSHMVDNLKVPDFIGENASSVLQSLNTQIINMCNHDVIKYCPEALPMLEDLQTLLSEYRGLDNARFARLRKRVEKVKSDLRALLEHRYAGKIDLAEYKESAIKTRQTAGLCDKILEKFFNTLEATKNSANAKKVYFGNLDIKYQKVILEMLRVAYSLSEHTKRLNIIDTFNICIDDLHKDNSTGLIFNMVSNATISPVLWERLSKVQDVSEKITILIEAVRYIKNGRLYLGDGDKDEVGYVYAKFDENKVVGIKDIFDLLDDDDLSADYNVKLSIFSICEKALIKYGDSWDLRQLRWKKLTAYIGILQSEHDAAARLTRVGSPAEHIKSLKGVGLEALLNCVPPGNVLKEPSVDLLNILGKKVGDAVKFSDILGYIEDLNRQRETAIQHGYLIDYDWVYRIVAEELSGNYLLIKDEIMAHLSSALENSSRNIKEIATHGLSGDDHTSLSSFLESSRHLISRGGGDSAAKFLHNALATEDPLIILHALSYMDDKSLEPLLDKYGGEEDLINAVKSAFEEDNKQEVSRLLGNLEEALSANGVKFHITIDKEFVQYAVDKAKLRDYNHEGTLKEAQTLEAYRAAVRENTSRRSDGAKKEGS